VSLARLRGEKKEGEERERRGEGGERRRGRGIVQVVTV